jgi:hypothetical protein
VFVGLINTYQYLKNQKRQNLSSVLDPKILKILLENIIKKFKIIRVGLTVLLGDLDE